MPVVIEPIHTNDLPALFALLEKVVFPKTGYTNMFQQH
jgi:hypothetical protein